MQIYYATLAQCYFQTINKAEHIMKMSSAKILLGLVSRSVMYRS